LAIHDVLNFAGKGFPGIVVVGGTRYVGDASCDTRSMALLVVPEKVYFLSKRSALFGVMANHGGEREMAMDFFI